MTHKPDNSLVNRDEPNSATKATTEKPMQKLVDRLYRGRPRPLNWVQPDETRAGSIPKRR